MKYRTPTKVVLAGTAVALTGLLAACGSSGNSATSSPSSTAASSSGSSSVPASSSAPPAGVVSVDASYGQTLPTGLGGTFPLPKRPPTGEHVCFEENGNEYTQLFQTGLEAAAKSLGWQLTIITVDQNNPSSYGTGVTSSEAAGCNAVIITGAQLANYQAEIPSAQAHKMVIEDANSTNAAGPGVIKVLDTTSIEYQEGQVAGYEVGQEAHKQHPTGQVLVQNLTVPQFATIFNPQLQGFKDALQKACGSRCSTYTVTDDLSVLTGPNPAAPFVAALRTHPNTDYAVQTGFTDIGVSAAIQQAGLRQPTMVGIDPLPGQVKDLGTSGSSTVAWVGQPDLPFGWYMADGLARYFDGVANTDPWSSLPLPLWVMTRSDAGTAQQGFDAFPSGYQSMFTKMWGVG